MTNYFKFTDQKADNDNTPSNVITLTYEYAYDDRDTNMILYYMSNGGLKAFPNFRMNHISEPENNNRQIHIYYSTGKITITGWNLEIMKNKIESNEISVVKAAHTNERNLTSNDPEYYEYSFCIDEITFEDNKS